MSVKIEATIHWRVGGRMCEKTKWRHGGPHNQIKYGFLNSDRVGLRVDSSFGLACPDCLHVLILT